MSHHDVPAGFCNGAITCSSAACAQDEDKSETSLQQKVMSRVLDQLPAAKASAVKVTVGVPDLQLERTTDFHRVSDNGTVSVHRDIDLQLGALQATIELKVCFAAQDYFARADARSTPTFP